MTKQEQAIEKINAVRGDHVFLGFVDGKYINAKHKILMRCPHGHEYDIIYKNFIYGHRCRFCKPKNLLPESKAIENINRVKGDYQFHGFAEEYHGRTTRLLMTCPNGHEYTPKYFRFVNEGKRCGKCAHNSKQSKEDVIARVNAVKGDYVFRGFDGDFKNTQTKLLMTCPNGHEYSVAPKAFFRGCRCRKCYQLLMSSNLSNADQPAYFYIQRLNDTHLKFGITSRSPEVRMAEQAQVSNLNHELIFTHKFENGQCAVDWETDIKFRYPCYAVAAEDMPDGYSETLEIKHLPALLKETQSYINFAEVDPDQAYYWCSDLPYHHAA